MVRVETTLVFDKWILHCGSHHVKRGNDVLIFSRLEECGADNLGKQSASYETVRLNGCRMQQVGTLLHRKQLDFSYGQTM